MKQEAELVTYEALGQHKSAYQVGNTRAKAKQIMTAKNMHPKTDRDPPNLLLTQPCPNIPNPVAPSQLCLTCWIPGCHAV